MTDDTDSDNDSYRENIDAKLDDVDRRTVLKGLGGAAALLGLGGGGYWAAEEGYLSPPAEEEEHGGGHEEESGHHEEDGGHGDHDHGENQYTEPQPTAEVKMVTEDGYHFDPHLVWIEEGGTVTWHNESGAHNTVAYHADNSKPQRIPEGAESWNSPLGEDYTHTFEEEGVYDYFCSPHEPMGMVGTVIVGHPDPHDQPGLEAPQDELYSEARAELEKLNEQVNDTLGHHH